jgi:hypothetical protein
MMDASITSSAYSWGTPDKPHDSMNPGSPYQDPNLSIDHDVELGDVFFTPGRRGEPQHEFDGSSSLSFDVTPSLTFEFDHDEDVEESHAEESRVEELLVGGEAERSQEGTGLDWSDMALSSRYVQLKHR